MTETHQPEPCDCQSCGIRNVPKTKGIYKATSNSDKSTAKKQTARLFENNQAEELKARSFQEQCERFLGKEESHRQENEEDLRDVIMQDGGPKLEGK